MAQAAWPMAHPGGTDAPAGQHLAVTGRRQMPVWDPAWQQGAAWGDCVPCLPCSPPSQDRC